MESDTCRKRKRDESYCRSDSFLEEDLPGPLGDSTSDSVGTAMANGSGKTQPTMVSMMSSATFRDYCSHNLQARVMMLENQLSTVLRELEVLKEKLPSIASAMPSSSSSASLNTSSSLPSLPTIELMSGASVCSPSSSTAKSLPAASGGRNDVIILDIGGQRFKTFRSTLCQHSSTMLARMFDPESRFSLPKEPDGAIFIDRSPKHFAAILNYLRCGRLDLPKTLEDTIEFEEECEYYGLPFPEDAYLKFPDCYTLEKVIHLPSSLPKIKEARRNFVMACADKGWNCGMINIFTGSYDESSNFSMNALFREEPKGVFSRGFVISDSGHARVWFLDQNRCYLTILDLPGSNLTTIELEGDAQEWESYNYRSIGTRDVLILYASANEKSIVKRFINLSTKKVVSPTWGRSGNGEDRDFCMQTVQIDNILACLFKVETGPQRTESARYIVAWNTLTWEFAWERKAPVNTLFILACEELILLVDENGAGYLLDPVRGSTVGIHHPIASQLEEACGRKLKSSDRVCCFGRQVVIWASNSRLLCMYTIGNHTTVTKIHGLLPFSNAARCSMYSLGQSLILVSNSARQIAVLSPSHRVS